MLSKNTYKSFLLIALLCCGLQLFPQNNKQKELETRRQEIREEIRRFNELRAENQSKQKSELSQIEDLNYKISVLNNLIKVTNQQANFLTREINSNQKKITNLRDELKQLKEDYANMIVKAYKSKNQQSKIMFLLSSNNFKQAYKRLQYIKQYSDHQKEQGEIIKEKTVELQNTNANLLKQKEEKQQLIAENRKTQKDLQGERKLHTELMKSIKSKINNYTAQIKKREREARKIDAEIDRIIKAAIADSNVKAGKSSSSTTFALTPEEKILASNFVSNKGKLPWPVDKGYVKLGYGRQPSPIDRTLTIQSNGVRIATERNAKVKAVFNGEVLAVGFVKNANPYVIIKHGNYLTMYRNLAKVYVKKGDKVTTKQSIGEVFTNRSNGESTLYFIVSKNGVTQNPASWVYKM